MPACARTRRRAGPRRRGGSDGDRADGALMQRAATGLATVCARLLGSTVYGARVAAVWPGRATTAATRCVPARCWPAGGRRSMHVLLGSQRSRGWARRAAAGRRPGRRATRRRRYDLVLDGIVGIGGRPGLRDEAAAVVADWRSSMRRSSAVDVPSGIEVDTGRVDGPHVEAAVTVTFGTPQDRAPRRPCGARRCGSRRAVDIGLAPYLGEPVVEAAAGRRRTPAAAGARHLTAHKYSRGVLGVVAGSAQYTGAGVLVVSAAVATGWPGWCATRARART